MSDDLVKSMEDDLRIGCSASIGDTQKAVAALKNQAAEITRLRAELATARLEGMEHVRTRLLWHQHNRCSGWREVRAFDHALEIIRKEIDAIRAAAKEGK